MATVYTYDEHGQVVWSEGPGVLEDVELVADTVNTWWKLSVLIRLGAVYTYDELREHGQVVWSEGPGVLVTWNGSATFNVWRDSGLSFRNVDVFTVYGIDNESDARQAAREHFTEENPA